MPRSLVRRHTGAARTPGTMPGLASECYKTSGFSRSRALKQKVFNRAAFLYPGAAGKRSQAITALTMVT